MPPKRNPLKLNKLQLRTLALVQVMCDDPTMARLDEESGEATIIRMPHAHGDHMHVGQYVVSSREASGLSNTAVWNAFARKGIARRGDGGEIIITAEGIAYDTGLSDRFLSPSDH
jgi:hypothetical protein